jgi:phage-related minor tail protein
VLDLGTLVGSLSLDDSKWQEALASSESSAKKFSTDVPAWMGGASLAIVGALAGAAVGLFALGGTFDDMADTIRIGTGASGESLDGLVDSAHNVAKKIPVDLSKVGPAIADLNTRLGLSGDTLETVASQFLEAGRILGEDLDINTASGALSVFKIEGDAVEGSLDKLFQISQSTGIGMNDLMGQLASAGPITQQLGFGFEETATMIGVMDKAGLDSQSMIGAMQKGLVNLTKPGESAEDAFKRVTGEINGMIASGDEAGAMDLAGQVFGTRGAAQFIGAMETGKLNLDDLIGSAELSGDTILGLAAETADFGETWQIFVNNVLARLEPIATTVFGAMSQGLKDVTNWADGAFTWIEENSQLVKTLGGSVLAFGLAFVVLTTAVKAYNIVMGVMRAITAAGSVAQWILNSAMFANPIGLVVLAVAALIAIIVALVMNWDTVVAFLTDVWAGFVGWFTGVMDGFLGWWGGIWDGMLGFLSDAWDNIVAFVTDGIAFLMDLFFKFHPLGIIIANWDAIMAFFAGLPAALVSAGMAIINGIVSGVTTGWTAMVAFFGAIPGTVVGWLASAGSWLLGAGTNLVTGLLNGVKNMWSGFMGFLQGIPGAVTGFFGGIGSWLFNAGKDLIQGLLNGVKSLAGTIGNFFLGLLPSWIVGPFKAALGIASPSKVFAGYGRNLVQGIVVGLDDEQDALNARMGNLVSVPSSTAATLALSASGAYGSGSRVATSSLTINGNVGWDAEEVARQSAERQRQAAALAGLDDLVGVA